MKIQVLILLILFSSILFGHEIDITQTELTLVIQTIRHGARYPIYHFRGMKEEKMHELSSTGVRQLFELGRIMREKYIIENKFLSEYYNHKEFYARSTDRTRTLDSTQSFLAGLYPQNTGPSIPKDMSKEDQDQYLMPPHSQPKNFKKYDGDGSIENKVQPIPIHTIEFSKDRFLINADEGNCKQLDELRQKFQNGEEMKKLKEIFKQDYEEFMKLIKDSIDQDLEMKQVAQYVDNLICNEFNGEELPQGWKENKRLQKRMKDLGTLVFYLYYFGNEEIVNLAISPYLIYLLKLIDNRVYQKHQIKYYALITHDVTIANILNVFKLASWQCIQNNLINDSISPDCTHYELKFASDIIFEVRYHPPTQQYIIVFLFNGKIIQLQPGKDYMLLKDFKKLIFKSIVKDYDQQCSYTNEKLETQSPQDHQNKKKQPLQAEQPQNHSQPQSLIQQDENSYFLQIQKEISLLPQHIRCLFYFLLLVILLFIIVFIFLVMEKNQYQQQIKKLQEKKNN